MLCDYGCNKEANFYFEKVKKHCCSASWHSCPAKHAIQSAASVAGHKNPHRKRRHDSIGVLIENDILKCHYGCGNIANFVMILNSGEKIFSCSQTRQRCPALRKKQGETLRLKIQSGEIATNMGKRCSFGKYSLMPIEQLFRVYDINEEIPPAGSFVNNLIHRVGVLYKCANEECSILEWLGKSISLPLHHKNGNRRDNRIENLEFLCPNCHTQTENYATKNLTGKKFSRGNRFGQPR